MEILEAVDDRLVPVYDSFAVRIHDPHVGLKSRTFGLLFHDFGDVILLGLL